MIIELSNPNQNFFTEFCPEADYFKNIPNPKLYPLLAIIVKQDIPISECVQVSVKKIA